MSQTMLLRSGLLILVCLCFACSPEFQDDAWRMRELHCAATNNVTVWNDYWKGGNVDVVQAIDSKGQEHRANRAIRELQHGFPLSKAEFEGAKWISPRSISHARKQLVIEQLHNCVKQQGWRGEHMSEADQADIVAHELDVDEDVPWSEIWRACYAVKHKGCYSQLDCEP
jgi:hypothetical protein